MKNRKRFYLSQYLNIVDQDTNEQVGYLADLSKEGMMFIAQDRIPVDTKMNICIMLDYHEDGVSDSVVKAQIQVRWVKPNINQGMFCTGCKILKVDSESKKKLEQTVHALEFDSELKIRRVSCLESDLQPKKTH